MIDKEGQVVSTGCLETLKSYMLAAEQGCAEAQYSLGKIYLEGSLVPSDPKRAYKWFMLSAKQGYADVQYELGRFLYNLGQLSDEEKKDSTQVYHDSLKWLYLAVEQGHSKAQFALGVMHEEGLGTPKDIKKAVILYNLSAAQENAEAQYHLGHIYHYGADCIKEDNFYAYMWFNLAASNGHKNGVRMRGRAKNDITPEQIAKAQKTLRESIKKPPNGFDPLDFIGCNDGVKKRDLDKGVKALNKRDYLTAFHEFQPRAERGEAKALCCLGSMYKRGLGVSKNYPEALRLFDLAAQQGHAGAMTNLAEMYYKERGVPKNFKKSAELFGLASKQGYKDAQFYLGIMYANGEGVPEDYVIAHVLFDVSVFNGYKKGAELRDDIAENMTPEQIEEAQTLAKNIKGAR